MNRSIVRVSLVVGIALLAFGVLAMSLPMLSSAEEETPPFLELAEVGRESGSICFWSAQGPVCVERPVKVRGTEQDTEELLAALLAGPTVEERARGLLSAIPEGTTLETLDVQPDQIVIVRLDVPLESLRDLDPDTFEIIVHQIGWTLEPLRWEELRIETWDPVIGEFVPLADFLPEIPSPRKEAALTGGPHPRTASPMPGQGQPRGALSGKTVYVSAGHGWQWSDFVNNWRTQRPPYPNPPYDGPIIEDHNNAEAVNQYLLYYLWNAGALVIPARERDMNAAEVIVDDGAPGTFSTTGAWTATLGAGYADTDYLWAEAAVGAPTAAAVWTATLPVDGRYAVYVWYRQGENRAADARYTVHHAGGATEVVLNQRVHGNTWRYLGTFGFRGGEEGRVTLTNQSIVAGSVVVADAVRFGGGTFDDLTGIETVAPCPPNKPWWEVAAYYYTQRMGMDPAYGDVTARPIYARWEHAGTGDDAVYVSWHTNGYNGYQWDYRGTVSIIHNGYGKPLTPGSEALRDAIHDELVQDIRAGWDPTWPGYRRSMNLGELRELWDSDNSEYSLPGALIEIAYHDHPGDTDALKEPAFEMLAARALYQGIVKYFAQRDGANLTLLPEPPTHLAVQNVGSGQVSVSWQPSPTDCLDLVGDAATGYRVYTSTDGLGWSNGTLVTGTTVYTLTDLAPGQLVFVRVAATNDGGESFPTETLAVRVGDGVGVLLVNGFDRLNTTMLVSEYDPAEGWNSRMHLDRMNRYDYVIQHAEVISYPFDSAGNEAVQAGRVGLSDYAVVDWILGEESSIDETLDATERMLLESFLASGGALFVSGAEVGWHLDYLGADPAFYNTALRADYVGDDAGTYTVAPVAGTGSIFEGLGSLRFDAPGMYDADYPDRIAPINGSVAALIYQGGTGGIAAVQYADHCERLVYFGFPFETLWSDQRPDVMARVLDFLDECLVLPTDTGIDTPVYGSAHNTVPSFVGTAKAYSAMLQRVDVQVERDSGGRCWTGSDWVTETTWLTATGTEVWSYTLPISLTNSEYHLRARAWTTDGYSDPSPAEVVFTYDTLSPTRATLITPTGGVAISALSGVSLVWETVADEGSPLACVVRLDGRFYTTTQSAYTVTDVTDGPHEWGVQIFDAAGNRSDLVTDTFSVSRNYQWLPLVAREVEEEPKTCTDIIINGGFESDGESWVLNKAGYVMTEVKSGARSALVGILPEEPAPGTGGYIYSSARQQVTLPPGSSAMLRLWVYPINENDDPHSLHYIYLSEQVDVTTSDRREWEQREYDVSAYLGQMVTLYIGAKNDGDADTAAMYVDDVVLEVCP